jgi:hypothetical protein
VLHPQTRTLPGTAAGLASCASNYDGCHSANYGQALLHGGNGCSYILASCGSSFASFASSFASSFATSFANSFASSGLGAYAIATSGHESGHGGYAPVTRNERRHKPGDGAPGDGAAVCANHSDACALGPGYVALLV